MLGWIRGELEGAVGLTIHDRNSDSCKSYHTVTREIDILHKVSSFLSSLTWNFSKGAFVAIGLVINSTVRILNLSITCFI